jgi:hypothetical protein
MSSPPLTAPKVLFSSGSALLLLLSVAWTSSSAAEGLPDVGARVQWTLHDENDDAQTGYTLYKRKPHGSDYDAYRLEAIVDSAPAIVAEAARSNLADPEKSQKGMDKKVIRNDDNGIVVYSYIHINAPFVSDRDIVSHIDRSYDAATDTFTLAWHATDEGPPPIEGVTRVGRSEGSWTFSPESEGRTRAVYISHTEVTGFVPAWFINATMSSTMVEGLRGLRESVELAGQIE